MKRFAIFTLMLLLLVFWGSSFLFAGTSCPSTVDLKIQVQVVFENDADHSMRNIVEPMLPRPGTTEEGVTYVGGSRNLTIKYMFIRYGDDASPELRNRIRFNASLWKKDKAIASGDLMTTMDRIGRFEPEIMLWRGSILHSRICELLVPKTMEIEIDENVAEAVNLHELKPEKIHVKVKEIRDQFGPIIREPEGDIYCISLRTANQFWTLETEPRYFTESQLLDSGADLDISKWTWECFPDNPDIMKNCNRPRIFILARMSKVFGSGPSSGDPVIKGPEDHEVTILCPFKIKSDRVISVKPGEKRDIPFQVVSSFTGKDDRPVKKILVGEIKISDPSFGRLSVDQCQTDEEGKTGNLYLYVNNNVREGQSAEITCRLCTGLSDKWLGKDKNGKPIPWEQTGRIKVVVLPKIEVKVDAHVELSKELVTTRTAERSFHEDREVTKAGGNFGLHFNVQFESRTEERYENPEIGFKGYRVAYQGKAEDVRLTLANPSPKRRTHDVNGWFIEKKCGKISYNYRKSKEEHKTRLKNPSVGLDVFYNHFIPDKDSSLRNHPVEGLTFTQVTQSMSPAIVHEIKLSSASRECQPESCSVRIIPGRSHTVPAPFMVDQSFPMTLCAMLCEGCYGFEEVFEPIMNDQARDLYRKLKADGKTFDALHINKRISLGTGDRANCWEIEDSPGVRHSGFVRGRLKWDCTAKTLEGGFDLDLHTVVPPEKADTGGKKVKKTKTESEDSAGSDDSGGLGGGELFMLDENGNPISPEKFLEDLDK